MERDGRGSVGSSIEKCILEGDEVGYILPKKHFSRRHTELWVAAMTRTRQSNSDRHGNNQQMDH